jgi:hypothetical protein
MNAARKGEAPAPIRAKPRKPAAKKSPAKPALKTALKTPVKTAKAKGVKE